MFTLSGLKLQSRRGGWWFVVVASVGLALTLIVTGMVVADQHASRRRLFEAMGQDIQQRLGPFFMLEHGLRGTRAMVQAVGGFGVITDEQFNTFARSREIGEEFPGTRGIALAKRMPSGADKSGVADLRRKGWQVSRLWSLGPNTGDRYTVVAAYPLERNFDALGGDIASDPQRASTIAGAIRTGAAQLSPPIDLIRSADDRLERGFLIVLPVYAGQTVPQTERDRIVTATGVVVMPVVIEERMKLFRWARDQIQLGISDVTDPRRPIPLYEAPGRAVMGDLAQTILLRVHNRTWQLSLRATPAFDDMGQGTPWWLMALLGATISLAAASAALIAARTLERIGNLNARLKAQAAVRSAELEEARANALASSRQMITLIEENPQGIALLTLAPFDIAEANPRFRELIPNLGKLETLLAPMFQTEEPAAGTASELTVICEEGRWLRFTCSRMDAAREGDRRYILMVEDVTAAHEQRLMLDEALARLYLASETAQIGIWYWNFADSTVQWDARMFAIFGRTAEERATLDPSYQFWVDCLHPDDVAQAEDSLNQANANDTDWACNYRIICANGDVRTIEAFAMQRRDESGKSIGMLGVCRDATERLQLAAELIAAKHEAEAANKAKDRFLANISHELRTPMNAILGLLQILERDELGNAQRLHVTSAKRAAKALLRILNDILDFSRFSSGLVDLVAEPLRLHQVTDATVALYEEAAKRKGIHLAARLNGDPERQYWGDELRLGQILNNLVDNAVKFTGAGTVEIEVSCRADGADRDLVRFAVRDTGPGLGNGEAHRLFEPFVQAEPSITRSFGGSGLGLAICRQLVQAMGGAIGAESNPGGGALFWFEVPLEHGADARLQQVQQLEPGRVLILTAQEDYGHLLLGQLNSLGLTGKLATGPDGLIADLTEGSGHGQAFDLLLVDLPCAEGELQAIAQALRAIQRDRLIPHVPLLVLRGTELAWAGAQLPEGLIPDAELAKPVPALNLYQVLCDLQRKGFTDRPFARTDFTQKQIAAALAARAGARILLVEDNTTNQEVALAMLEQFGLSVDAVRNGAEAVQRLAVQDYAMVLMDIHMPVMNGVEATRAIRAGQGNARIPIVAMTASAFPEDRRSAFDAGMSDFIGKPIDADRLAVMLVRWLPASGASMRMIDRAALERRLGGGAGRAGRVLRAFVEDFEPWKEKAARALELADHAELDALVHSLKGAAGGIGADELARGANALDEVLRAGSPSPDWPAIAGLLDKLLAQLAATIAELRALASGATAAAPE